MGCAGSAPDDRQGVGSLCYKLQEICAYDTATQFVARAPATSAEEVALLRLRIAPRTSYKSGGLISKGLATVQVPYIALKIYQWMQTSACGTAELRLLA